MQEPLRASPPEIETGAVLSRLPGGSGMRWRQYGSLPGRQAPRLMPWEKRYRNAVVAGDVLVTGLTVCAGGVIVSHAGVGGQHGVLLAMTTFVVMLSALVSSWNHRILGQGVEEFHRFGRAVLVAAVVLALLGLGTGTLHVRPWVFAVLPSVAGLCVIHRYLLRKLLHRRRSGGHCLLPVIAAGDPGALEDLIECSRRESHVGWDVQAVCTPVTHSDRDASEGEIASVPIVGTLEDLADRVRCGGYRVVAISSDPYWTRRRLQRLAWELEDTPAEMVVAPVLMDVAGPRLHVSEVLGMPLLRVSAPMLTGPRLLVKSLLDRVGALAMLLVLSPLLLGLAAAVRMQGGGPAVYRQQRVGRHGTVFTMLKFRTMIPGADSMRSQLDVSDEGAGPLFKRRSDPRVTRLGALLRRYSLDELPQLINVLTGRMSLVGPRPPLPEETAQYGPEVRRKFMVTPGMTGLWQVSGRSDLSWAESVRLDLRYVEHWSLALDAMILWKTVRAVVTKRGAY